MFCLFVDKCQYQQTNAYSKVPIETCELCLKLTIKTSERRQGRRFGVFIANIERVSHVFLSFFQDLQKLLDEEL